MSGNAICFGDSIQYVEGVVSGNAICFGDSIQYVDGVVSGSAICFNIVHISRIMICDRECVASLIVYSWFTVARCFVKTS